MFDQAVVSSDRLFRVFARLSEGPQSRLGMAVSRKVDARASVRNRIRRVIRESFRLHHPLGQRAAHAGDGSVKSPAKDYVVLAAPSAATAANAQLIDSLSHHWQAVDHKLAHPGTSAGQETDPEK